MREMLKPEYIFTNQQPASERLEDALKLIGEKCSIYAKVKPAKLTKAFLKREKMDSTGFGEHLAIPHAKVKGLENPMIAIFRFTNGVEWNSVDGKLVKVAIALIMPDKDEDNTHLVVLAKLSRKLMHEAFMKALLELEGKAELYEFIIKEMGEES